MKARLFAARPFYSVVSVTITNDSLSAIRQVKLKYRGRVSTLHDYESRIAITIVNHRLAADNFQGCVKCDVTALHIRA